MPDPAGSFSRPAAEASLPSVTSGPVRSNVLLPPLVRAHRSWLCCTGIWRRRTSPREKSSMTRAALFATLAFLTSPLLGLVGCDDVSTGKAPPALPAVTVARPLQKVITEWDEYTGRFASVATVEVRARVSG